MAAKLIDGLTAASGVELARTSLFELQVPGANATRKVTALQLMQMFPGAVINFKQTTSTSSETTQTVIPADGTVPQSNEGAAYDHTNVAYTPLVSTSLLLIDFWAICAGSSGQSCVVALFKDAEASALAATIGVGPTSTDTGHGTAVLRYSELAGSTVARTYKIRFGRTGGSGTVYLNQASSGSAFGAASIAFMRVTEIVPPPA